MELLLKSNRRAAIVAGVLGTAVWLAATPVLAQTTAAQFEIRFQQLEQQVRALTGQIEELNFNVRRLQDQLERNQADMEMRLQMGDAGPGVQELAPGARAAGAPALAAAKSPPTQKRLVIVQSGTESTTVPVGGASPASSATTSQTAAAPAVSALPAAAMAPTVANSPVTITPAATSGTASGGTTVLPQGAPAEDYNNAYALLQQADYAGAARAFDAFLAAHPDDPLAGNAQYWLAETFYVREDYHRAAVQFAEGYKKYPTGPKAPANLLKLGMSLGRLGKVDEACASLDELDRRFPDAPGNVQQYARTERQRLNCG